MALTNADRTADRHARSALVQEQVDEVEIPGAEGYFGVLPGHTPLLASLAVGELWYRKGQEKTYLSIAFGFAEVLPDRVTILARLAERAEEIDVERAEAARKRAEERLAAAEIRHRLRARADRADARHLSACRSPHESAASRDGRNEADAHTRLIEYP